MQTALQYLEERDSAAEVKRPLERDKAELKEFINEHGKEDEDGSLVVTFPHPVKINGVTYTGLKQEKRAVPVVDEEKAMELVEEKGLLGAIPQEVVVVYDWEDGLYVLNAKKKITDEELDEVLGESVTWALQVIK